MRIDDRVAVALLAVLALAASDSCLYAGQSAWQPSPGHTQLAIWPGPMPDPHPIKGPEMAGTVTSKLVESLRRRHCDCVARITA